MAAVAEARAADGARPDLPPAGPPSADLPPADLLGWTAGRLETWMLEQQGMCILAAAVACAAVLAPIAQHFAKRFRMPKGEARLRRRLAQAGCDLIALRVRLVRRDGPGPAPEAVPEPDAPEPDIPELDIPDFGGGLSKPADRETWKVDPGAGRPTARLIMKAPSPGEARVIFDRHRAAAHRTDPARAVWAMLWRLEMEADAPAIHDLAETFGDADELCIDGAAADDLERLYFAAGAARDIGGRP